MGPVAPVISAIAPFVGTAATLYGAYSQYEAGKDAEKEAKYRTEAEMADERNRTRAEQAERRARLAASGVQTSGSPTLFMQQAKKQDDERLRWMKRTGKTRADYLRSEGTTGAVSSLAKIPGYWI